MLQIIIKRDNDRMLCGANAAQERCAVQKLRDRVDPVRAGHRVRNSRIVSQLRSRLQSLTRIISKGTPRSARTRCNRRTNSQRRFAV